MKRSKYLTPLSWEHHSALVNASRIKRGLALKADTAILQEFMEYLWKTDLQPHFQREEDAFLPQKDWQQVAEDLRSHMLNDHKEFARLAEQISKTTAVGKKTEAMERFADLLTSHVRFEERQLFPAIEDAFDEDALIAIGAQLKERHVPGCIHWQPAFWEKGK